MRYAIAVLAALAASATIASAADTAPADVKFDDSGAIEHPLTAQPGDAARGAELYSDRTAANCVACHQLSAMADVPFQGTIAPALDGAGDRWTEAQLRGIVADAKKTFDSSMMPSFYKTTGYVRPGEGFTGKAPAGDLQPILDAQQIEDVVAYLSTLKEE
jgi:sulfur-oxidizing protein SoxX